MMICGLNFHVNLCLKMVTNHIVVILKYCIEPLEKRVILWLKNIILTSKKNGKLMSFIF